MIQLREACVFLLCLYTIICSIPVSMLIEMKIKTDFVEKQCEKQIPHGVLIFLATVL